MTKMTQPAPPRREPDTGSVDLPVVMLLGPTLDAVSGVSAHVGMLCNSALRRAFDMRHFRIGSEGHSESRMRRALRILADPARLFCALRRQNVAVLHINTSMNARAYWRDLVFVLVARLARCRVLFQVHGGALPQVFFRGRRLLTGWLRMSLRLPQHIVVLGQDEARSWRRFLPGRPVTTVPNAIDCRPYRGPRSEPDRRQLHVVYLGRLAIGKGLCELLHALASPRLAVDRPRLTIAGHGAEQRYLQALCRDLRLDKHVVFAGPLFGDRKVELLLSADVFVLASYSEGLPYALLESMAAGCAAITTPVGAIPDVVSDGVHGLFIPPRDPEAIAEALARLQHDRATLARMGKASRQRILARFDVRRLENDFRQLYGSLSRAPDARAWAEA